MICVGPSCALVNSIYFGAIGWNITFFFGLFAVSWATPAAYGGSQARGLIGAAAAGHSHSHSNARS